MIQNRYRSILLILCAMVLSALRYRLVPPTATTFGEKAGKPAGAPWSPVDARKVTPWCPAGVVK